MRKNILLIISLITVLTGILLNRYAELLSNKSRYPEKVKMVLTGKKEKSEFLFDRLERSSERDIPSIIEDAESEGIILLKYSSDSLIFWSSNNIPVYDKYSKEIFKSRIVKFFNSFYYVVTRQKGNDLTLGLISVKNRYPYENDFLHSGFNPDFRLPHKAIIGFTPGEGYDVNDEDGTYLFSIVIPNQSDPDNPRIIIGLAFIFLGIVFFAIYLFILIGWQKTSASRFLTGISVILLFILARSIMVFAGIRFSDLSLFNPYLYADSEFIPSLGDLLINSSLVFYVVLIIYRYTDLSNFLKSNSRIKKISVSCIISLGFLFLYLYAHYFSLSLINNSNISFQPNEMDQLSIYSLISILIIGINYSSAIIILIFGLKLFHERSDLLRFFWAFIVLSVIFLAGLFISGYAFDIPSVFYLYLLAAYLFFLSFRKTKIFRYSVLVLILFISSIYLMIFLTQQSCKKEEQVRASLALSLADEHDPVAEYLLEDISDRLGNEKVLRNLLANDQVDVEYLRKNYFKGYWNKYEIKVAICGPVDSVLIEEPDYQWFHCYNYYRQIIRDVGLKLSSSKFYYLNDYTGRISYLGVFPFPIDEYPFEITIYIELDSKLSNEFIGYPELLLDKRLQTERLIDQYSYAKYHKDELIAQYGNYSYSLNSGLFGMSDKKFSMVKLEGYTHLLYYPGLDNLIVVSLPRVKFIDVLIGFSYIFLLFYVCILFVFLIRSLNRHELRFLSDLRSKIQFSIIAILLASMFLIAASTIWLNIRNYRQNQDRTLHEKLQSIQIELTRRLGLTDELTATWNSRRYDNLNQLLIRYSDAFFTDINLYYPSGDLLATSRYEVFQAGLQGDKIDPVALYMLSKENQAQFIHRERIGSLSYQSAYIPFKNSSGKLLAYLNLPYFTKQAELQRALSTLIVTIINIYLILILITIVITVLITNQITRPLNMLQQRFRLLKIGDRYEQIDYKRKDEIGSLVEEYNRMVIELEKSVNLLARSERESAWREMAKQIAHEIKNPLTPMRLSVQQLQKLWKEKREDFDKYMESVSATLIEQIDNLSSIASEFSNFAKMPAAKIETIDLVNVLSKTVELFGGNDAYTIDYERPKDKILIDADKEQLSRVFLNLIKNATQSIPDAREGKIQITVEKRKKEVRVTITDNGSGIPEELRSKLFTPNFTTKSSGTGLGLAIVRNILDQLGGTIDFITKPGSGTSFFIDLPLS